MEIQGLPQISFSKSNIVDLEFEIFTLQNLFSRQNTINHSLEEPHRVKFYHIIFITEGKGFHNIDFHPYEYSEGDLIFVSQGQVHSFDVKSGVDGQVLLFTENFITKNLIHSDMLSFSRLYNYHIHQQRLPADGAKEEKFAEIFGEIYQEYNNPDLFAKEEILRSLLKLLLLKAERIQRTVGSQKKKSEWLIKFGILQNHLANNYAITRNVSEYATMMGISPKALNTICKSFSGGTAKEFIDNFVVLEIKRHLATSHRSVKELTYEMGFNEPTNFVKYFKKHTGQTPALFKKTLLK